MSDIALAFIQTSLFWEDRKANLLMFENHLQRLRDIPDVIVLPEMFSTGFSMNPGELFEDMQGETVAWLKKWSQNLGTVLTGSIIIRENNQFYNRLLWAEPHGTLMHYDKRHLFSMAGEHKVYTAGKLRLVTDLKGWRICPMICYDLRFPVWSRNTEDIDLYIYTANWPKMRIEAWNTLLCARAIENQAFVAGINRIGSDGNGYPYCGSSRVYDGAGGLLLDAKDQEGLFQVVLSRNELEKTRKKLPFLADRDKFKII